MIYFNFPFLTKTDVEKINTAVLQYNFVDGKVSMEGDSKARKKNAQLELNSSDTPSLYGALLQLIFEHELVKNLVYPKKVPRIFLNSYSVGSFYSWHVDSSIMNRERTDYSFTIWLNEPSEYEGGELQLRSPNEILQSFKCDAGHILLYPTGELHQVTEVTSGYRQAIVGWITSTVASYEDRAILFNMRKAMLAVREQNVPREPTDLLDQTYQLLLRRFSS